MSRAHSSDGRGLDRAFHASSVAILAARTSGAALLVLAAVVGASVGAAYGLHFSGRLNALSAWGVWIGAFVSSLALVGTSYAVISQIRQGETTSWSIALSRLGALYDLALENSDFAQMLAEASSPHEDPQPLYPPYTLTAQQRVWLGSLFLAYEQIYIATLSLSPESRRVWQIYISNQLNKPSIRAQFCRDAVTALDYHQAFWRFVRDKAIEERFFERYRNEDESQQDSLSDIHANGLTARPMTESDFEYWLTIYSDPEVKRQMYSAPTDSLEEFKAFLRKRTVFTVFQGDQRIGGFSITREGEYMGTFGFVIDNEHRGKGYGAPIMLMLEQQAKRMNMRTLRADVYDDNAGSIATLAKRGFRKFIWMEKNL